MDQTIALCEGKENIFRMPVNAYTDLIKSKKQWYYHRYISTGRCLPHYFIYNFLSFSVSVELSNSLTAHYQPLWICPRLGLAAFALHHDHVNQLPNPTRSPFCTPPTAQGRKVFPASRGAGKQAVWAKTDQSSPLRFRRGVLTDTSARLTSNMQPGFTPGSHSPLANTLPTRAWAGSSGFGTEGEKYL